MSTVDVIGATKRYGRVAALDDVSVRFGEGEFFGLIGPSGSGKTTLLRAIAGFADLDAGEIRVDSQPVGDRPPHKRDIGMVFQNYALFPHLTVFENVAFGLSVRGRPKEALRKDVGGMLDLVRLSGFEARKPRQLSGGQQQRVALARALVTRPRVLLLDEPLGALDKRLRQEMQIELRQIQREVGITTIFVTHDQEEALTLSDRIAIFNDGKVVQVGTPGEVYERPHSAFAAGFLGDANLFQGAVLDSRGIEIGGLGILRSADTLPAPGTHVNVAVRPEKIQVWVEGLATPGAELNRFQGRVQRTVYAGTNLTYKIEVGNHLMTVFEQNRTAHPLPAGTAVNVGWLPVHSVVVAP
jgi:spermidine/putrescine ABC transporter ATP-binding subunit